MLDWEKIDTVLLDMDGTLLDLNFDNHFWQEFVPLRYAQQHGMSVAQAKLLLEPCFKNMEGNLQWYCLDYWSERLNLDICALKAELSGLITVLPHVTEFLEIVHRSSRRLMLVTNAHPHSLGLKMEKTCLNRFFDLIVSSHQFGFPKENEMFWLKLQQQQSYQRQRTLLVDDSLSVLHTAKAFGIEYLISVSKPDSKQQAREITDFPSITDFRELLHAG